MADTEHARVTTDPGGSTPVGGVLDRPAAKLSLLVLRLATGFVFL